MQPTRAFAQHLKVGPCLTRPAYRDGRRKTAVKVFTVATESAYLLLFGVPSVNLDQQLKDQCKQIGPLQSITKLTDYPERERFTDVFLVKFDSVQTARCERIPFAQLVKLDHFALFFRIHSLSPSPIVSTPDLPSTTKSIILNAIFCSHRKAKRKLDDSSFYGGSLHICYAPEYETVAETRIKLHACRRDNGRIARKAEYDYAQRLRGCTSSSQPDAFPNENVDTVPASNSDVSGALEDCRGSSLPSSSIPSHVSSGDALDDARRYWLERGMDWMQLGVPPPNAPPTPDTSQAGKNDRAQDQVSCMGPNGRPLPLPVLQALSWRPYRVPARATKPDQPNQPTPTPGSSTDLSDNRVPADPSLFVPRCLQVHSSSNKANTQSSNPAPSSRNPINVGELKRLALTLGPVQGPSLQPVGNQVVLSAQKRTKRLNRWIPSPRVSCSRKMCVLRTAQLLPEYIVK
ncbi:unnamed protein product [Echinostoma caproni]|uniref:RNA-binding protein 48 n=1 Tax=Echinostoma caproni TaxID=27848 RepID=A0A183B4G2_9TREM|nr:unnamed protein product [Echinostoma caproni]